MKYDIDGHVWWAPEQRPFGMVYRKSSPDPPAVPDPAVVSQAQTQSNVDTARANAALNRVNQYTPYGNLVYSQSQKPTFDQAGYEKSYQDFNTKANDYIKTNPIAGLNYSDSGGWTGSADALAQLRAGVGDGPDKTKFTTPGSDEWNATVSLSPDQQKLLESNNNIQQQLANTAQSGLGRVTDAMGQPFDVSKLTQNGSIPQGGGAQNASLGGGAQTYNPTAGNYTTGLNGGAIQNSLGNTDYADQRKSVEDAIYARVNPKLQRDRAALDSRLANQGIMPGSEAYKTAIDESDRAANDARSQAVLAGGQEQSRLAGLALQAGQFANSAQAQDFGQQAVNAGLNNSVQDTQFNQGLQTAGFNNSAQQQNWAQQLAGTQANNAAQAQNFGQQAQSSQMSDAQRQQQLQEQAYLRSLPLNELNALRTGSQVSNPQFSSTPQANVANTNTAGNVFQAYGMGQQNASNQTAQNNSMTSGLFGLGAAGLGAYGSAAAGTAAATAAAQAAAANGLASFALASDRRLKTNIERIGTYRGIGVYQYDYLWGGGRQTGLMADELEAIQPDAVFTHPRGYKYVDYSKV